ncbi:MAG: hypothetical protein ACRDLM_12350, partial [Gaiellaceae bacterium]
ATSPDGSPVALSLPPHRGQSGVEMSDIETLIAAAKPAEQSVTLCLRGDLNVKIEDLERELEAAKGWKPGSLADTDPARELAEQIEATREEMREHSHVFKFRAVAPKAWSDLLALHPPRKDNDADGLFNLQTFPSAVIAACAIEPEMTAEQLDRLAAVLNQGQYDDLFMAAWRVNTRATDIPFSGAAYAILHNTEQS